MSIVETSAQCRSSKKDERAHARDDFAQERASSRFIRSCDTAGASLRRRATEASAGSACATCTYQVGATALSARAPSSPTARVQQAVERLEHRADRLPRRRAAPSSGRARRSDAPAALRARPGSLPRGSSCRCPARPSRVTIRPRPVARRSIRRRERARSSSRPTVCRSAIAGAALNRRRLRVARGERRQRLPSTSPAVGRSQDPSRASRCTSCSSPDGTAGFSRDSGIGVLPTRSPPAPPASSAATNGRRLASIS